MKLRCHPKTKVPMNFADNVRRARVNAQLTQSEAAKLVYLGSGARWAEYESGVRTPDQARWILFLLLTNQHPRLRLVTSTEVELMNELAMTVRK